jgi:hypothetical protein
MAITVIYAVELAELERWVGARDERLLAEGRSVLRDADEDEAWSEEELELLDTLLRRMVMDGKVYAGLAAQERYYLTQLLIDLFDEFVDSEAVTEEIPHASLVAALDTLRQREPSLENLTLFLSQGRTLGGDDTLWRRDEDIDDTLPFFGYIRSTELAAMLPALERGLGVAARRTGRDRTIEPVRPLVSAARLAVETERDLLSFTG